MCNVGTCRGQRGTRILLYLQEGRKSNQLTN